MSIVYVFGIVDLMNFAMSLSTTNIQTQSPHDEAEDINIQEELNKLWSEAEKKYSKKRKLSDELKKGSDRDSLDTLLCKVKKDRDQNLRDRQKSMVRRTGATLTDLCTTLSKFLENYSGIADIIKGVDDKAGSIAYGGLSVLLTASYLLYRLHRRLADYQVQVARNKNDSEKIISEALVDITESLQDIRDYQEIYKEKTLQEPIFSVYRGVFKFVIHVWEYYNRSSTCTSTNFQFSASRTNNRVEC